MTQKTDPASRRHTWLRAVVFAAKTWVFRARRFFFGPRVTWLEILEHRPDAPLAAESRTVLRTSTVAAELRLQEGKIHNLAVAARYLNGLRIPAGEVFSFWRHVPRPTRRSGFKEGRELREGCIIPSVGGGLCQLSNALYSAALDAGCEIIERHAHTHVVPGSATAAGRDATVFWNYVDLRFRPRFDLWLEVALSGNELIVRLWGRAAPVSVVESSVSGADAASCETCGVETCRRNRLIHKSS